MKPFLDSGGEMVDNYIPGEDQISKLYREMYGRMFVYASSVLQNKKKKKEAAKNTFCIF